MASKLAVFHQSDVTRALKAAKSAEIAVAAYEITADGTIRVFAEGSSSAPQSSLCGSWDDLD